MTKEQLDQFKEFPDWYGNEEYREKVDKLNDSRDLYYLSSRIRLVNFLVQCT